MKAKVKPSGKYLPARRGVLNSKKGRKGHVSNLVLKDSPSVLVQIITPTGEIAYASVSGEVYMPATYAKVNEIDYRRFNTSNKTVRVTADGRFVTKENNSSVRKSGYYRKLSNADSRVNQDDEVHINKKC
jgi:hypothetical protein